MVAPLIVAGGIAAANMYQSEQNRAQNQRLMDEMRDRVNAIGLPQLSEADFAYQAIDPNQIMYDEYQYGGDYAPEFGEFVREADPRMVERSEAAKYGRDAQLEALKKFRANISSGYDPEFEAKMDQASRQSQGDAQSRMASILQDAQRRGQLGSNAMLAAQMQGSSDAMNRGSMESQLAAIEAYKNQLQQQRDVSGMGRQLAGDEENFAARNADITNSFNQRTSRAYQQYLDQQNEMRNQANLRNLNTRQDIGNQNVGLRNQQMMDRYKAQQVERSAQNQAAAQRQGVRQNIFNNQMSQATGQNNLGQAQMGMNDQSAMARMNAVQGLGQGVMGYMGTQEAASARADDRKWQTEQNQLDREARYGSRG